TKTVDQSLLKEPLARFGQDELSRQVLAGGYRIIDRTIHAPELDPADTVNIFVGGFVVPTAIAAARRLHEEGVAANVIKVNSADQLYAALRDGRKKQLEDAHAPIALEHLATLIPESARHAPIVTIQDGASHAMSYLG